MADKTTNVDDVVSRLQPGMTIGIGGWGSRRKPMSIVRAIARSGLSDLTVVSYGGPDVGLLCATGVASRVLTAFVSLDSIPLDPHYRAARQRGTVEEVPFDEGMFLLGLQAAAWRIPFLPTRVGLGTDLLRLNPDLRTVRSPYDDAEELVAAPALRLDAAFVHMNRADARGNAGYLGSDPYFDDLMLEAATLRVVSCERLVGLDDLGEQIPLQARIVGRLMVDAVVESPGGAHFTACPGDYGRDEDFQREYAGSVRDPEAWALFRSRWIDVDDDEYRARLEARP